MRKIIVGLTGQSGAGKSTISFLFMQNDFKVINADRISRFVTSQADTHILLQKYFGENIVVDKQLNRRALAKIVFSDKEKLQILNDLLFPLITKEIEKEIQNSENEYIILDAPQLFESGANRICDKIISVVAPRKQLIDRIVERDDISEEDAIKRLDSQLTEQFFIEHSDYVIRNDSSYSDFINNGKKVVKNIKEIYKNNEKYLTR